MTGYVYMSHGEPLINEKGEIHLARKNECEDVSTKNGIFECSECGCIVKEDGVDWGEVNYCPDCGKAVKR